MSRIENLNNTDNKCEKPHWAAHQGFCIHQESSVLPIFSESAATPGMMKHGLNIGLSVKNFLNEG